MDITSENDLLRYLAQRADSGEKQWFGRMQQRVTGITLAHEIAANHADKMTPEQVANYVVDLNNQIFKKIVIG
jgi:two-component sensor histidine kinase